MIVLGKGILFEKKKERKKESTKAVLSSPGHHAMRKIKPRRPLLVPVFASRTCRQQEYSQENEYSSCIIKSY